MPFPGPWSFFKISPAESGARGEPKAAVPASLPPNYCTVSVKVTGVTVPVDAVMLTVPAFAPVV
jgi:hypothetical protein